jgi:hypothetical protein
MAKARTSPKDKSTKKAPAAKGPADKIAGKDDKAVQQSSKAVSRSSTAGEQTPDSAAPAPAQASEGGPGILEDAHLPATHGKVGVFGGPKDRGVKPDDKLALPTGLHFVYERVRTLKPESFYCAMRWDYHLLHKSPEEGKRWWANRKLLVTNPGTGKAVVVRAVDYGPHENTGLDIGISPGAADALGVEVGDEVDIAFADQKAPLGPVE